MHINGKKFTIQVITFSLCVLFSSHLIIAQDFNDVQSLFHLNYTLKTLSAASYEELQESVGKWVMLTGTVASQAVINPDEEQFMGQLEIIDGEWDGTEQVHMYQCYVLVNGPEWVDKIPVRRSRRPSPDVIPLNANVLIIGQLVEPYIDESGYTSPIVEGFYIRIIQ